MFIIGGNPVMGGLDTTVTYITSNATNTNQSTYTSPSFSTLTESTRRLAIIGFRETNLTANLTAPVSCTLTPDVGSPVAAALIEQDPPSGTSLVFYQLWAAPIPTGANATAAITRAANMTGQVAFVWVGENLRSFTPIDSITSAFADPSTASINVQSQGFVVGAGYATSGAGFAWTNLGEDADSTLGTISYTAAHQSKTSGSSLSITLDTSVSCNFLAASWR